MARRQAIEFRPVQGGSQRMVALGIVMPTADVPGAWPRVWSVDPAKRQVGARMAQPWTVDDKQQRCVSAGLAPFPFGVARCPTLFQCHGSWCFRHV